MPEEIYRWSWGIPDDYEDRQFVFWMKNQAEDKDVVEMIRSTMLEF